MTKNKLQKLSSLGVAAVVLGSVLAPVGVSAVASGSNANDSVDIAATVNSVISINAGTDVSFSVTPKSGGSISSASDTVTVSTNSSTGYVLAIQANRNLTNQAAGGNSETFAAASGSIETPAPLTEGKWGFATPLTEEAGVNDNSSMLTGGFDATYSPVTSAGVVAMDTGYDSNWAAVPTVAALPIKNTDGIADAEKTQVLFAANAGMLQATGTYTATVTYTATTNAQG